MQRSGPYVAVCGPDPAPVELAERAERVGALLAQAGATVVCGGHGGVMEAAARGAATLGGVVVGILPGDDRAAASPFLTVALTTGMGELRNGLIVRAVDVVIALGGGFGTLSEVALALKTGVPVVGLDTWEVRKWDSGDEPTPDPVVRVGDADAAVAEALRLATSRSG